MRARTLGTSLAAGLAIVGWGLAPAAANQKRHGRADRPITFTGSCDGSATVTFEPPLTNAPRSLTQHARGPLACSGSLVDARGRSHKLTNARVIYDATERGDNISCGLGIDAGNGSLAFRWGKLRFVASEKRVAALATLSYTGAKGGSATATATAGGDPAVAVQQCAGSGIKRISVNLSIDAGNGISG
jgi:hypothetical protein